MAIDCFVKAGGKTKEEKALCVEEKFECIDVNQGNCRSPVECLWVRTKGVVSKGALNVSICY